MPYFEKCKGVKKQATGQSVDESLISFTKVEFPGLLESLSSEQAKIEFIELLKLLVLAHRHNRNDEFLANPLVAFNTVREPMYKYSKQAQDNFFAMSTYAFLFMWFDASQKGRNFAAEKFAENSDKRHSVRMTNEVVMLGEEAKNCLFNASSSQ